MEIKKYDQTYLWPMNEKAERILSALQQKGDLCHSA